MTVKVYVSRDSEGHLWAPDNVHEADAAQEIVKKLWVAFHHLPSLYVVIANLHEPNADMVMMTERGLGVVELKHYPGTVSIRADGIWYADNKPILSGTYPNPHRQVQSYAETIRQRILPFIVPKSMQRDPRQWDTLKFQTTICFTHSDVKLDRAREVLLHAPASQRKAWESSFSITVPGDMPNWACNLRFQVDMGRERRFEPHRLSAETLINVATLRLGATEWSELLSLMPTGEPYAYLVLKENNQSVQTFNLHQEECVIGRNPDKCDVLIPDRFERVSRIHARIKRQISGIVIEDLSRHGTYVDGVLVGKEQMLRHGQRITLGGAAATDTACQVEFLLKSDADIHPTSTQSSTTENNNS